ncbi:hypothetical protein C8R45DRAFT_1133455 [Mycena sanguinolenta]|nr:hypothetical protein C8R45DRAFT_1133455 [Mycena sanguinolenta]
MAAALLIGRGLLRVFIDRFIQFPLDADVYWDPVYPEFEGAAGALPSWLLECIGVTNLCALSPRTAHILPSISGFTNINFLTIDIRALFGTTLPLPLFLTVTHLELLHVAPVLEHVDAFCHMRRSVPMRNSNASSSTTRAPLDDSPLLDDSRFVCIDDGASYEADWLCGAVFGKVYRSFADEFLAARRAGTIPRSQYRIVNGEHLHFMKGD